jgi:hypothetical protein
VKNKESSLAEKISKLIESESRSSEVATLFAAVERLERRLERLETTVPVTDKRGIEPPIHPSRDRFTIAEAIADAVFDGVSNDKTCTFEPNGRSCDHCAMCSSRGF